MNLRDRRALVTGCSRGIGPHIARALARAGVHLVVTARTAPPLTELAGELARDFGVRAVALPSDLDDPTHRVALVERAVAALGGIDILVNNAGVEHAGPFTELALAQVDELVRVNVVAPVHLTQLVLPGMLVRGSGRIITIASLGGKKAVAYDALYGGTKAAVIEWSNALRSELRGTGVTLSVVCPGYVTEVGMFARFGVTAPRMVGSCSPQDVARAVVRAARAGGPELVVNSLPIRPHLALYALFPRLFDWIPHAFGIVRLQRRKVGLDG